MKRTFIDTNVLIYADDAHGKRKQARAQEVIEAHLRAGSAVLSTQVLQEYFVVATRKLGLSKEAARRRIDLYSRLDVVRIDPALILSAIDLHRLHTFSFWDALILAAANRGSCRELLTEDLQPGRTLEGLTITNPFAA